MANKRGRPTVESEDPAVRQRRERTAQRNRNYYARLRAARAAVTPVNVPQLQQGERIVDLAFTDWDAAETLAQLGLRTQGLTLAQDPNAARLQADAVPVDEHDALYDEHNIMLTHHVQEHSRNHAEITRDDALAPSSNRGLQQQASQSSIGRFFPTLPPRNPFPSAPSRPQSEAPPSFSHPRGSDPPSPILNVIDSFRTQGGSEDWRYEDNDRDDDTGDEEEAEHDHHYVFDGEEDRGDEHGPVSQMEDIVDPQDAVDRSQGGDPDNHDEDSTYHFASEHSGDGDHEDDSGEISAQEHTLQKLYDQLQGGHHGCPPEQHDEQLREHVAAVGDDHHGLGDIFNDPDFPSVLALSDVISPDRLAQQPVPTAAQWKAMFCGIDPQQRPPRPRPMHVCLHQEQTQAIEPRVAFDIDSFLGFASSLAMARQGLWYQPAPQMRQNMTNDVHLETNIFRDSDDADRPPRASLALLRDVPHFLLGRVEGAHDITVHILFPHLGSRQDKFTSLTQEQLSRWLDQIFHPAVYRYCEAHYTQHLPASYRNALADSKAHQVEGRQVHTASYQAQQSIGYHLQPEYLEPIWTDILSAIRDTPGLADFRDPQLFFSAKGTKLQFKTSPSRPTLLDAMQNFESYFERIIDTDFVYLDRFYVDIGKEICPRTSLVPSQSGQFGDEAQVFAWKRCCLEHYMRWMYDGEPPAMHARGQRYYDQNMLYDASSLTSVTPKRSKLREGGIIYSQFYGSVKEISDASKRMPFDNDGLEELALDPQIRQGARSAAGGHRRDAKILERAYCASKRRTRDALLDAVRKSFGIREEHRITWSLFHRLLRRLRLEVAEDLEIAMFDCPSYAWAVKTEVYFNFLWRSADKFATGFEVVLARCQRDLVTWEQTKMMAMFLRCLRFVFGGHQLRRESALWWSRRERPTRAWYGLGFCNTLPRYKYCWLEPRINWERLVFKSRITDEVLFGNSVLRDQYLRRGGQVRDFFDATRQLELALDWTSQHHGNETIRDQLIFWMIHICLKQFRVDILGSVQHEIAEEHREEALLGQRGFCFDYFEEILRDAVHLISGNRCDFKQASHLGHFLFDFDDGRVRKHWEDRPFRKLYRRARTAMRLQQPHLARMFSRRFWRTLYMYHWILPYPCAEVLLQTTKQGQRMWYSIQPTSTTDVPLAFLDANGWEWARKSWREGVPPALPRYLAWSKEEWQGWIESNMGG